jgi:uncharacterized protein YutE (UPF0331/DUF86 family)
MVDPERLHRILRRVSDDLAFLDSYRSVDGEELLSDPARLGHVKYLFVTAIEGCIDAAQHICASEGWGPPETNGDAFRIVARHGALDPALAERMAAAVGFRNVLVHGYAKVENRRVLVHLRDLDALHALVARFAALIEA